MTDRHAGYIVILEKDIREDDAKDLIRAIMMLKGVIKVKPVVGDATLLIAEERAKTVLGRKLFEVLEKTV